MFSSCSEKTVVVGVERFETLDGGLGLSHEMLVAAVLDEIVAQDGHAERPSAKAEENHKEKEVEDTLPEHGLTADFGPESYFGAT